jgi:hypothetical protein
MTWALTPCRLCLPEKYIYPARSWPPAALTIAQTPRRPQELSNRIPQAITLCRSSSRRPAPETRLPQQCTPPRWLPHAAIVAAIQTCTVDGACPKTPLHPNRDALPLPHPSDVVFLSGMKTCRMGDLVAHRPHPCLFSYGGLGRKPK